MKGGNDVITHLHVLLTKCGAPKIVILIERKKVINNEILGFQISLKNRISILDQLKYFYSFKIKTYKLHCFGIKRYKIHRDGYSYMGSIQKNYLHV